MFGHHGEWKDKPEGGGVYFYWEAGRMWADVAGVQTSARGTGTIHTIDFLSPLKYTGKQSWQYADLPELFARGGKWFGPLTHPEFPKEGAGNI